MEGKKSKKKNQVKNEKKVETQNPCFKEKNELPEQEGVYNPFEKRQVKNRNVIKGSFCECKWCLKALFLSKV